jgi:hypothetical protein
MRSFILFAMCALFCTAVLQGWAFAQDPAPGKAPGPSPAQEARKAENEDLQELVNDIMAARLARELALNDADTVVLLRRLGEYRAQLNALQKERREVMKSLKTALKGDAPETEIEADLAKLLDLDARAQGLKRDTFAKIGEGMSVAQRARLYVFYNDFENEMRRLVQKARERAAQRRGQPGDASAPGPPEAEPPSRPPQGGSARPGRSGLARPLSGTRGSN